MVLVAVEEITSQVREEVDQLLADWQPMIDYYMTKQTATSPPNTTAHNNLRERQGSATIQAAAISAQPRKPPTIRAAAISADF